MFLKRTKGWCWQYLVYTYICMQTHIRWCVNVWIWGRRRDSRGSSFIVVNWHRVWIDFFYFLFSIFLCWIYLFIRIYSFFLYSFTNNMIFAWMHVFILYTLSVVYIFNFWLNRRVSLPMCLCRLFKRMKKQQQE